MKILGGGFLLLVLALVTLFHTQTSTGFNSTIGGDEIRCVESERRALLAFKQGLVDEHGRLSSWGSEEVKRDCCKWEGIQCSNTTGHITGLNLTASGRYDFTLRGNLSPSLFELQRLTYLDLSWNNFNLSRIPESISLLNKIEHLDLTFCNLSGSLLSKLENLTSLQFLDLSGNNFDPVENLEWLSHLSSLKHLDLSTNDLSKANNHWLQLINKLPRLTNLHLFGCNLVDVVPQSIPIINTSLAVLDLGYNNFTASIYQWLFHFSDSIVSLNLDHNLIQGLIPKDIGHMSYLEVLSLRSNQFEGGIPKSFGNLCRLRHLYLSNNSLEGMLPQLIGNLSGCLQLSLEVLGWDQNNIKGPLPDMIKNFSSLRALDLSNNQLRGAVPKSIGLLSKLESLSISSNSFEGMIIEAHFSKLSKLSSLDLSFNPLSFNFSPEWIPPFQLDLILLGSCKLGPKFPSWLQTQRNFSVLDISENGISDNIPKWFWNLSSRAVQVDLSSNHIYGILPNLSTKFSGSPGVGIDLSRNKLEGSLPTFPADITSINLSENMLSGSISSLCSITGMSLTFLDLSYNQLFGELPDCMTTWTRLVILNLASNNFYGKIPSSIGSLSNLQSFGLGNNSFSGEIPWSLGNCSVLQFLDLSYNRFSGIIPAWIGERLSFLTFFILRSNNFSGDIPLQLCWLTDIMVLDLSSNDLSGSTPFCIHNLTALAQKESSVADHFFDSSRIDNSSSYVGTYADKASVIWKGAEYYYGNGNLKTLRVVDLSSNKLKGGIPVQISLLFELIQLNLSRNQLTRGVPLDIGQLRQMESLDLSQNQLSGQLPESMSQLNFLGTLNVSYNNFSGRIPSGTQMQSINATAFVGNPALCGPPLTPTCPKDEESESSPRRQ